MQLEHLHLADFRNYDSLAVDLPGGVVVLHGDNGAGKTSFLEAVCVAATGDSPRARTTAEMVRSGRDYGFVCADFLGPGGATKIEVGLARAGQRQLKLAGVPRRRTELIGRVPVVLFWVEDIEMVRGEAAARRKLLNRELAAVRPAYDYHLRRYRRALEQRNRLLKLVRERKATPEALEPWDRAAARHGAHLMTARASFIAILGPAAQQAHATVASRQQRLGVAYRPSVGMPDGQMADGDGKDEAARVEETAERVLCALQADRALDLRSGVTSSGPHRDDVELLLDALPVRTFGSQGEQRSCAVALRLGSAAVLRQMTGQRPLVLLDDVLSELDEQHRRGVFEACDADQVIITCCDQQDIPPQVRASSAVFSVVDGRVERDL